ncbi:MAG: hypothetical protein ACLRTT_04480 [Lachnospiraceae bacterium]
MILQFIKIFAAYTGITVFLPAVMFRRILKGRRLSEKFLMCYTFGNFYIINIVFTLQLMHISNVFTLCLVTALLSVLIGCRVNRISPKALIKKNGEVFRKLLQGTMGVKEAIFRIGRKLTVSGRKTGGIFYREVVCDVLQWILTGAVLLALFWVYGRQLVLTYGYRASDIPVHLNWINQMSRGNLFVSGVYPFGFHCMIYYLHTVFRIDTYMILCLFYLVQVFFIHMVFLAMLKMLCKSKYLPYAGTLIYILGSFWARQTYSRFYSSLPQEFGMIFVIPSVYFLIRFFQIEKEQLKTKETKIILGNFALAFSLTLAIHFYGTMIAGLCCIGIAIGFCTHFLNKEYFRRIMLTGIISVFLAVLPMAIAFAGGTPMQGSLGWGLSVISGGKKTDTADQVKTGNLSVQNRSLEEIAAQLQENSANQDGGSGEEVVQNTTEAPKPSMTEKMKSVLEKIARIPEKIKNTWKMMAQRIWDFVINTPTKWPSYAILAGIACLIVLGIVFCVIRNAGYGKMLLSVGLCMGILTLLLCAGNLGLPVLMDPARCSIYYTYLLAAALTVLADGIISLLFMQGVLKICLDPISFMITVGLVVGCISQGWMKVSDFSSGYVSNGALTCLANIIKENEDKTWTIVLRMTRLRWDWIMDGIMRRLLF